MTRGWLIATIALGVTCAAFAFESLALKLSDTLGPGPGFFPFWLGLLGVALSGGLIWQLSTGRADLGDEPLSFERAAVRQVVTVIAILAAATLLLDLLGFRLTMLVMIASLLVVLDIHRTVVVAGFSLVGSFGIYHVFAAWLKVPLPIGVLGF
ncbi:MAG: tripartite tricarboxylate transporter TctB family protein [Burkholderiales bacterium]